MPQTLIENPILNSPYLEPTRHWRLIDEQITSDIVEGRRVSSYFMPVAKVRRRTKVQTARMPGIDDAPLPSRREENSEINRIRERVRQWRAGGWAGVTATTRRLLDYWSDPERENKLFFCQLEAVETAIYLTEAAEKFGDGWIAAFLRDSNAKANPGLPRVALKMATGTGKTVVMAMLIAWQALNKIANPQDTRFSDGFLLVAPGITIRDRLRVLIPNDPENYYRKRSLLTPEQLRQLGQATIVIVNYHAFGRRESVKAASLTKKVLDSDNTSAFTETPDQMVRRVCRALWGKKNIIVINDEAHHCYRENPASAQEKLDAEERGEVTRRNKEARLWINGLEAVQNKLQLRAIYDLSATPFFLRGSGYPEGTLFPWVVSDFALMDAIESGLVKIPRLPVEDNAMDAEMPIYRELYPHIADELPRKGRRKTEEEQSSGEPKPPRALEGALHSLYGNYRRAYEEWETAARALPGASTPPVFIVVCNNTAVSKMVFDYIAGWEKEIQGNKVVQAGKLELFRNDNGAGGWLPLPNTILIDSEQLESGEALSPEFRKIAAWQIEEFQQEYRQRYPERAVENITDEEILREVMNTVGKAGKLGAHVRCVVSVSMLTEGWDANTVTHILGVRRFGTQLLCEQVVGRALRRISYTPEADGLFAPEYAEVYGVPFSFIPTNGTLGKITPPPHSTRVQSLDERSHAEITFPRLVGYRYDLPAETLSATFTRESTYALSTRDVPTMTTSAPIVGAATVDTLDDLKARRLNGVAFQLAKLTLEEYFQDADGNPAPWLFPSLLNIAREWLATQLYCKDNTFPQLLLLVEHAHNAADRIYSAIARGKEGIATLRPILRPYDPIGSTGYVDFDTARQVYETDPAKCHINYVVADTLFWEQKGAQALEEMPEVLRYVKNHNLGFTIPYTFNGRERSYVPDFIAVMDDGQPDPLHLIVEVTGERTDEKAAKVNTARALWVPAVNNHGGSGRWQFLEISDPWDMQNTIRGFMRRLRGEMELKGETS